MPRLIDYEIDERRARITAGETRLTALREKAQALELAIGRVRMKDDAMRAAYDDALRRLDVADRQKSGVLDRYLPPVGPGHEARRAVAIARERLEQAKRELPGKGRPELLTPRERGAAAERKYVLTVAIPAVATELAQLRRELAHFEQERDSYS